MSAPPLSMTREEEEEEERRKKRIFNGSKAHAGGLKKVIEGGEKKAQTSQHAALCSPPLFTSYVNKIVLYYLFSTLTHNKDNHSIHLPCILLCPHTLPQLVPIN
jgi:hypothetical protein